MSAACTVPPYRPRRPRVPRGGLVAAVLLVAAVPACTAGPQPLGTAPGSAAPLSATTSAGPPTADVRSFRSPSGNISCEFDRAGGHVYCQTGEPPQSVRLAASGTWSPCHGPTCIGNPGESVVTVPYGSAVSAGPFTCASSTDGITCTTGGRGFRIASQGIVAVPQAGA